MPFPLHRLRRLRANENLRKLVRETRLSPSNFILPLFVCEGDGVRKDISSMPGHAQLSVDLIVNECREADLWESAESFFSAYRNTRMSMLPGRMMTPASSSEPFGRSNRKLPICWS